MIVKFITLILAIIAMTFGNSYGQEVKLDNAANIGQMWHNQPDSIMAGSTYVFNIRLIAGATSQKGIINGFRIYSPDGTTWTTTVGDTIGNLGGTEFELIFSIDYFGNTGSDTDTIIFKGSSITESGLVSTYDSVAYTISIGPIPSGSTNHGKTICIDSLSCLLSAVWIWEGPEVFPSWNGPFCYTIIDEATNVVEDFDGLPASFGLSQNYPNPFNPITTINYNLPKMSDVNLTIYNVIGQKVTEFREKNKAADFNHNFKWDASAVVSGIYFYKLTAGDFTATKKMMLLK